jgi:hypothetical protein
VPSVTHPSIARTATVALLTALLIGCAASTHPVGPLSEAVTEPRLAGVWENEGSADHDEYVHILPSEDGKQLQIVAVDHGDKSWAVLDGYVTAVGEKRLLNLRIAAASARLVADVEGSGHEDTHPYAFAAYAFEGDDRLAVAYVYEPLREAVKEGRLAGEMDGEYDVYVADSPAAITAVLGAVESAALFEDAERYRRVRSGP